MGFNLSEMENYRRILSRGMTWSELAYNRITHVASLAIVCRVKGGCVCKNLSQDDCSHSPEILAQNMVVVVVRSDFILVMF